MVDKGHDWLVVFTRLTTGGSISCTLRCSHAIAMTKLYGYLSRNVRLLVPILRMVLTHAALRLVGRVGGFNHLMRVQGRVLARSPALKNVAPCQPKQRTCLLVSWPCTAPPGALLIWTMMLNKFTTLLSILHD